jgi:hypothetical protein
MACHEDRRFCHQSLYSQHLSVEQHQRREPLTVGNRDDDTINNGSELFAVGSSDLIDLQQL